MTEENASFGQGSGPIYLDSLVCTGTEPTLLDCRYSQFHSCFHEDDVSVRCQGEATGLSVCPIEPY